MNRATNPTPSSQKPENSQASAKPTKPPSRRRRDNGLIFVTTWIAGVLAAAASILFGIWAPLSYKAAADGNRDNNAVQSSMLSSVSMANSIAQAALSTVSAQASLLQDTQSQLVAMGQLALVQFCATQTADNLCSTFLASVPFTSLVSYLAATPPEATAFPSATETGTSASGPIATEPAAPGESSTPSAFPVAAILGIVFGIVGVGGLALGIIIWRYRKQSSAQDGGEY